MHLLLAAAALLVLILPSGITVGLLHHSHVARRVGWILAYCALILGTLVLAAAAVDGILEAAA